MFELFVTGRTLPEAYHNALVALHAQHDEMPCPDYNTNQKESSLTFVVECATAEPMISRLFIGDPRALEQYRQEMLDGILDFQVALGNWEYTYHLRMEGQIPWIIDELRRNPHSRRAVISIRDEHDLESASPACLQSIQFLIRGGALHCKTLFRSNDAAKATFMNAFALVMLQERVAAQVGVPVGSYTHRANSFHVYERDYPLLEAYVARIKRGGEIAYNYVGDWDALMRDAQPDIAESVRQLKEER
ncbi:MAG: thymidylate synthase [Oscillospiraceae bacterium]|jgi:thymidylate synthase|nr:thymidylate synthase [Oscillospiraceae bacterium]